jgi:hypothetical protein
MKNGYVKITFEDAEIARIFFENDKHFDEFLSQVCRYYLGIENVFKYKNVKKYFETYKKVMDRVIIGRDTGSKGGLQRVENQKDTINTLEGPLIGPLEPPLIDPLVPKERKLIKERKLREINKEKKLTKKEQFLLDFDEQLISVFNDRPEIESSILEWIDFKFDKGKGYSTLKWLTSILKYSDYQVNEAVQVSLSREYAGLFPDNIKDKNIKSTKPQVEYVHFYCPSTGNSVLTRERFESRKKSYEPLGEIFEILRTEWKDAD